MIRSKLGVLDPLVVIKYRSKDYIAIIRNNLNILKFYTLFVFDLYFVPAPTGSINDISQILDAINYSWKREGRQRHGSG